MHVVFLDAHHLDRRAVRNFRKNPPASARPIPQIDDSPSAGVRHKHRQNAAGHIGRLFRKKNRLVSVAVPDLRISLDLPRHADMRVDFIFLPGHVLHHIDGRSAEIGHQVFRKQIGFRINVHHAV